MRYLTLKDAVFLTITSIVGGGIFVLSPLTYTIAGKCAIYGWIIDLVISLIMATPFAYASTKITKSGGPYKYIQKIFGIKIGKIFGYMLWFSGVVSISAVVSFFEVIFNVYFDFKYIGIVLIIIITALVLSGIKVIKNILRLFAIITILILIFIICSNGLDLNIFSTAKFDISKIFMASYFGLWTMTGWEGIVIPSESFKNPKKDISYGLIIGTFIVGILYLFYAWSISSNAIYGNLEIVIKSLIKNNMVVWLGMLMIIAGCIFSWTFTLSWMPKSLFPKIFELKPIKHLENSKKDISIIGVLLNAFIIAFFSMSSSKTLVDISLFMVLVSYFGVYFAVFKGADSAIYKYFAFISCLVVLIILIFRIAYFIIY
ncbi:APC family permease [Methanothermococcus okinawensis]|uniref:AsoB protein n=1 Tax=Methanothermococcus okinawensis (strain DSM 14208 / JCM 11175 / IH1) TaxID=647113 RepID=F8AMD1_METOI|nr:amino acid permease [Methanothermococcus okinawensis]AEH06822.1 AsoB protein [Methanothermococcus okinawensis IH1]